MDIRSTVLLGNNVEIPRLGLGTWQSAVGSETRNAVVWALEAGYRHIDTAAIYGNEQDVGAAVVASGVPRSELFLTTKCWNEDQGFDNALRAFDVSAKKLGSDYIDLFLIHWPVKGLRNDTWRAFTRLYEEKRCRAIGVSNFTMNHLIELLSRTSVVPAANQIELSPFLQRRDLVEFCQNKGITIEAYSPLARGRKLSDPRLMEIAKRYEKSPAQIAIRWALQHNLVVIPKSVHKERIQENAQVFDFEISLLDMQALDALDEGYWTMSPAWNPETSSRWN
jgi:diketogulonate reductase-like aldo/keto reductase